MAKRLVLVCGQSTGGKTSSLSGLKNQEKVLYLNTESAKGGNLPFRNKFMKKIITEPLGQIIGENSYLAQAAAYPGKIDTIVLDSLTFLMEMFELKYIQGKDTRGGWKAYGDFYRNLLNQVVPKLPQTVVMTAHTCDVYDELTLTNDVKIKLKGSIMSNGAEAYFNDIVAAKKVKLSVLQEYENDLLHITDLDKELGYKHVLQTRLTPSTVNERIRSNIDMWARNETFIDGNVQLVIDRLNEYYGD